MIPLLIIYGALGVLWLANHGIGLLAIIAVTLYLIDCSLRVRIECRRCHGSGTILKSGRRFSLCPVCKGRKHHVRLGSMVWRRNRYLFTDDPEAEEPEEDARPGGHDRGLW